jgi:hypothetical protein
VFVVVHVGVVEGKETQNRTKLLEPNKDKRSSDIKFHENPSNLSRALPCGRTDMTKLRVAFRTFSNAPKMREIECLLDVQS